MSMDAVEFVNKMNRMCLKYPGCVGCPIETENQDEDCMSKVPAEQMVAIVEKWTSEHPRKTRQSVFLEQYPDADISDDGLPDVAPCQLCVGLIHGESTEDCENRGLCVECRREFWDQEVE